jgi:hypothetical protein
MKNTLLVTILFFTCFSWGQNYRPIPETDATWIQADFLYSYYNGHEHATITSVLYTQNDTLINGLSYCKLGSHGFADWVDNFGSQQNQTSGTDIMPYSTGCFRQDTILKKVFLWNNSTQMDELLYDFGSLVVGQPYPATITNIGYPYLLVMATDSVQLIDGNYYKRWILGTDSSDSAYVSVIEGVGATSGFTSSIYPVFEQSSSLLCHKTNTQHIYENWISNPIPPRYSEECSQTLSTHQVAESNLEIYPNPTNSAIYIQTGEVIQSVEICNLSGQLLFNEKNSSGEKNLNLDLSKLESGTYILKIVLSDDSLVMERVQLVK